jgi:hypothetical protein
MNDTYSEIPTDEQDQLRDTFNSMMYAYCALKTIKQTLVDKGDYIRVAFIRDLEKYWNTNLTQGL